MSPALSARIHRGTGLALCAFIVVHVAIALSASAGPRSFVASSFGEGGGFLVTSLEVLVVGLIVLHATLGVLGVRRRRTEDDADRKLQAASGIVVLAFVAFHVVTCFLPKIMGTPAALRHASLADTLGRTSYLGIYVVGLTALAFHFARGVGSALGALGEARGFGSAPSARLVGYVLGVAVWLVALDAIAPFAIGRALLFTRGDAPLQHQAPEVEPWDASTPSPSTR